MTTNHHDHEIAAFAGLTVDEVTTQRAAAADLVRRSRAIAVEVASIVDTLDALRACWSLVDDAGIDDRWEAIETALGTEEVDSVLALVGYVAGRASSQSLHPRDAIEASVERLGLDLAILGPRSSTDY